MVKFNRFTLDNGLRVIVHEDNTTPMAVVNILYDVGSRDESPEQTGFAHLFEHLMFGGSVNIPNYDGPLQSVGGENNAFTSNDITNYYITLPSANIETAFWLESDRMLSLAFSEKSLEVQRNVVIEEFKQRYLNQPYGDVWLRLRPMVFKKHPYRWDTIGKTIEHIADAKIEDVKAFFKKHYNPQNAIMVVGGDVKLDQVKQLSEKWFGPIPRGEKYNRSLPQEDEQHEIRRDTITAKVPVNDIYIALQMPGRRENEFHAVELISDILSRGNSSRLYRTLVKDKQLFSEVHAYVFGSLDKGMFVLEGKPTEGVSVEDAEAAIWEEVQKLTVNEVPVDELTKVQNKTESTMIFSEMSLLDKAMNLAYYELLGDAEMFNQETEKFLAVTPGEIKEEAIKLFRKDNSSTLIYLADN
ncbi:MAG TPA: pitrilysin family protein [Mucilaginibacter sp.]